MRGRWWSGWPALAATVGLPVSGWANGDYLEAVVSQAPLAYWALDEAVRDGRVEAAVDGTGVDVVPGAAAGGGVEAGVGSGGGRGGGLLPGAGFLGFGEDNRWAVFDGTAAAVLSGLLERVDGTGPGGLGDGAGSVSFWFSSDGEPDVTGSPVQHLFYGSREPGGDGFGTQDELHVNLTPGGGVQLFSRQTAGGGVNRDVATDSAYTDGRWHHVAATWDAAADAMVLYVDGGLLGRGETMTTDLAGAGEEMEFATAIRCGRGLSAGRRFFRGRLDGLALWGRALRPEEVLAQFRAGTVGSVDEDGDGLPDAWEVANFGDTAAQSGDGDPDDDGLDNAGELAAGTLPTERDSDGDRLDDGAETGTWEFNGADDAGTSPLDVDTDGDGLRDGDEVFDLGTDPTNADTDGDGMGDGYEERWFGDQDQGADDDFDADGASNGAEHAAGSFPSVADSDGDGLTDGIELNEAKCDPLNPDSDGDRLSDGQEWWGTGTDPLARDSDGDGFPDGLEVGAGSDPSERGSVPVELGDGGDWRVRAVKEDEVVGGAQLDTLPEAMVLLNPTLTDGAGAAEAEAEEVVKALNYGPAAGGAAGRFGDDRAMPTAGFSAGRRFAVLAEADVLVEESGVYTLMVHADDGVRVRVDGVGGTVVAFEDAADGGAGRFGSVFLEAGLRRVQVVYFQVTGDASLELAVYRGRGEVRTFGGADEWSLLGAMDPADADGDDLPDVWERFYFGVKGSAGATRDSDVDGWSDGVELAWATDPSNADSDGDGLKDGLEKVTDPLDADTDDDGLPDGWETTTDPTEGDSDGDGFADGVEVAAGGGENDAKRFPDGGRIVWVSDGDSGAELEYSGVVPWLAGRANDDGFVRFLRAAGYGVQVADAGLNGYSDAEGGPGNSKGPALAAADVVVISRNTNSGNYDGYNEAWDAVAVPVVSLSAYVIRNSRMRWLEGANNAVAEFGGAVMEVVASTDALVEGLGVGEGESVSPVLGTTSVNAGNVAVGNGTVLAVTEGGEDLWAARWVGGTPFFPGGSVPAAERVHVALGSGGVNPTPGVFNLSDAGERMMSNVIEDLVWRRRAGAAYLGWRDGFGGLEGSAGRPEADPDGDGLANVLEYAFGLDPGRSSVAGGGDPAARNAPTLVEGRGGERWLEFGLTEGRDVLVAGEVSEDGAKWVDSALQALGGGRYRVRLPAGWRGGFVRVRATLAQ